MFCLEGMNGFALMQPFKVWYTDEGSALRRPLDSTTVALRTTEIAVDARIGVIFAALTSINHITISKFLTINAS